MNLYETIHVWVCRKDKEAACIVYVNNNLSKISYARCKYLNS